MNILLIEWKSFGNIDIKEAFVECGYNVKSFYINDKSQLFDAGFEAVLKNHIEGSDTVLEKHIGDSEAVPNNHIEGSDTVLEKHTGGSEDSSNIDFVFSFNYFPLIANVCKDLNIKYVSWVYDNPYVLLYDCSIIYPTNYVFLFDKSQFLEFRQNRINTVYYLPLAVNPKRISKQLSDAKQLEQFNNSVWRNKADISFIGSLYQDEHQFYKRLTNISDYTRGYLEGLIATQRVIYGENLVEASLPASIIEDMYKALPLDPNPTGCETREYLYAQYVINRHITSLERTDYLNDILSGHSLDLYTNNENIALNSIINLSTGTSFNNHEAWGKNTNTSGTGNTGKDISCKNIPDNRDKDMCSKNVSGAGDKNISSKNTSENRAQNICYNHGPVDYYDYAPFVFNRSRINLNISLRSIKTGIPLRCFDILGSRGFLLSNYQADFEDCYIAGEDYIFFENRDDLLEKIDYYLNHEKERLEIASHGYETTVQNHTYLHRVQTIIETIYNN